MASLLKNVASQNITFTLVNATTGAALTSATFTALAWVTKDNVQAGFAGTFTTLGNGQFNYAPTQSETNCTDFGLLITPSNAVPVNLDFHTDLAAPLTGAQIATAVWTDTTAGDFTTALSIGKTVVNGVALGTGITINAYTGDTPQTGDSFVRIGALGAGLTGITNVTLAASQPGVTIPTVTTVTNQLTAAAVAAGVWRDAVAGDFAVAGSIGASLGGAFTSLGTPVYSIAALANAPSGSGSSPAAIATAVWQDATGTDFTTASSIGKSLYNAFTSNTSVYTVAALANAPSGSGSSPAAIATAVWQDTTAGDFTVASSIGKSLYTSGIVPGAAGGLFIAGANAATTVNITGNITGNLSGSVGSVTGSVGSVTGAVGSVTGNVGGSVVGSVGSVTGLTPGTIATGVWQDTTAGDFTVASSAGRSIFTGVAPGAVGGYFIAGSNAATTVNFTGNLSGSVGSVLGSVGSVTGSVGSVVGSVGSVTGSVGSVTSPVTIASNIKQNVGINGFMFVMTDSTTHAPKPGLGVGVTPLRAIDGGAFAATTNAVAEIANGVYTINLSAADLNGGKIMLNFQAAAADPLNIELVTQP